MKGWRLREVSLITAGPQPVILSGVFCFSHWQQDVEEADTSAICNRTLVSPRSKPAASRECFLCFQSWLLNVSVASSVCEADRRKVFQSF